MRVIGLDVGDRTIGLAVSDPMGWTAQGIGVWRRTRPGADVAHILELIERYDADSVVVGLPINMNATLGPQAEKVQDFVRSLQAETDVPVVTWDERLTTRAAERVLLEADLSRARRKQVVDQVAAQLILQNYLDSLPQENDTEPGPTNSRTE